MSNSRTTYRAVGFSEQEVCEHCGRDDLKRTVALDVLDIDGNRIERVYYGTTCAARATGRKSAAIALEAQQAERSRRTATAEVAQTVEYLRSLGDTAHGIAKELRCRARDLESASGAPTVYTEAKIAAYRAASATLAATK